MTGARALRVYTIPPEIPFLDALASGLVARFFDAGDPDRFAVATILLPTRRAARALSEALLSAAMTAGLGSALVLPKIRALGDVDEDALLLSEPDPADPASLSVPPALGGMRRRLLLLELVRHFFDRSSTETRVPSVGHMMRLSGELEGLLDRAATQGVRLADLDRLVPDSLAEHWAEVLAFLQIITEHWPRILAAHGAIEPAERRNRLMDAAGAAFRKAPPGAPVIAAGSTGTIPATARLLRLIAGLPDGAVILPGLDQSLDKAAWDAVNASHPQGAMKALIETLGIARDEVELWPFGRAEGDGLRVRFMAEALRPWSTTDGWHEHAEALKRALDAAADGGLGLTRIDAPHAGLEAKAVALILRHALEQPDQTAALVTPDRRLARAVVAELSRWDIEVDDSAGLPLANTKPMVFLRLLASAAEAGLAPVPLLALLKHPLAAAGVAPGACRALTRQLERAALRGPAPAQGFAGLRAALSAGRNDRADRRLEAFIDRLEAALGPFVADMADDAEKPLAALARRHLAAAEALAATDNAPGTERLWVGDAGEAAGLVFGELLSEDAFLPDIRPSDYPGFIEAWLETRVLRPAFGRHPRLSIWGPLEARLQRADTIVLGGLNEGTWPREPAGDPWLSRPMMDALGLPPPEQRLGLSAHDFLQAAGQARAVFLTRAAKVDGAPTVPSRWLVRLEALLGGLGRMQHMQSGVTWLALAEALDRPLRALPPVAAPSPTPPVEARPRRLSVTDVERWVRDPYALYAKHVLKLKPLDPLDAKPGPTLRGLILHAIFQTFTESGKDPQADDALDTLITLGAEVFDAHNVPTPVRALWWPRFVSAAAWFITEAREQRVAGAVPVAVEVAGRLTLAGPAGPFILTARADRIDRARDGTLEIYDYKSGNLPTEKQMRAGLAPQLPLEAAIAEAGGFAEIPPARVSTLRLMQLKGDAQGGVSRAVADAATLGAEALARLKRRIADFDDPAMPYRAAVAPMFRSYRGPGDYDHLARVAEWSAAGDEDGEP